MAKYILGVLLLSGFDIGTKLLARSFLVYHEIRILDGVLELAFFSNAGISYGLFQNNKFVTHIFPLVLIALLAIICKKFISKEEIEQIIRYKIDRIALVMLVAGFLGNYIERLIMGDVTDFISIKNFPTFNFADVFLTFGGYVILFRCGCLCFAKWKKKSDTE